MFFASLFFFRRFDPWPAWLGFLRPESRHATPSRVDGFSAAEGAGREKPGDPQSAARAAGVALPQFKIQCIPLEPAAALRASVQAECEAQAVAGLKLVSTFTHDGHVFLVFKRP